MKNSNDMSGKKALFVCFKRYSSILDGGGMANQRCHRMLQQAFGPSRVDAIYVHDESQPSSSLRAARLARAAWYTLHGYHNGITPAFVRKVVAMAPAYSHVFLSTSLFGIIARELKAHAYQGNIITHFHNVESIYYNAIVPKWLPGRSLIIRCAELGDALSCQHSDKIVVLNTRDKALLYERYGRQADAVLPIALPDTLAAADTAATTAPRPLCTFIGSYFAPNVEGITWFAKNVLPHVDIRLKVVGKNMSRLLTADNRQWLANVEVVSDAPTLAPHFAEADFIVLPIFAGSGMKVKTCEAMMHGKNILGTDEAFEGYDIDAAKMGARCNTAQGFIDSLRHYAAHPVPRFNAYARQQYLEHHTEQATSAVFAQLLNTHP